LAAARVKSTYLKYSQMASRAGLTGAEVAARILKNAGIYNVEITAQEGMLGDHYDPLNKRLVLCHENYFGTSPAAYGVCAHECGHALQDQQAYAPLKIRMAAVGVTTYAN
jgi:Zn-dependent membrane protease YugP